MVDVSNIVAQFSWWWGLVAVALLLVARLLTTLPRRISPLGLGPAHVGAPCSTLVVFGSGGHTAEMLSLLGALDSARYTPQFYVCAATDTTSAPRAKAAKVVPEDAPFYAIPRSREVGQSYVTSVFTTLWALAGTVSLVWRIRPDLVLCNGPGTCVPVCAAAFLGRFLGVWSPRILFVESACRVHSLSLSGRILYSTLADSFLVQWPDLHRKYPATTLTGLLL